MAWRRVVWYKFTEVSQRLTTSIFIVIFCSLYTTRRNKAVSSNQRLEQQICYFKLRKGYSRDDGSRVPSIEEPFFWIAAPAVHACWLQAAPCGYQMYHQKKADEKLVMEMTGVRWGDSWHDADATLRSLAFTKAVENTRAHSEQV